MNSDNSTSLYNKNGKFSFTLDVIIPLRTREEYDVLPRLAFRQKYNIPENVNFIIVDHGSTETDSLRIKNLCRELGFKYVFIEARNRLFNPSEARNVALFESDADYVVFEDVDLISHKDLYYWLNRQILSLLEKQNYPFFALPVPYLTESGSEFISQPMNDEQYDDLVSEIYQVPHSDQIEFYAPVSSHLICKRQYAILVGGFDENFECWGFEDSDFALRLLRSSSIDKPREFYRLDTRPYHNQVQWRGWRAMYRVFGDLMANKGIYSFHLWHQHSAYRSSAIRERNHKIFQQNSLRYANEKFELPPLWNSKKKSHLFLSKNPHSFTQALFQHFDNPLLIDENSIKVSGLQELIKKYNIEAVIFTNPYGTERRLLVYRGFKKLGIPCYVVERGALPWSIYIDDGGFCADSLSYKEDRWPVVLTPEDRKKTNEYIIDLKTTGASLEPQSSLIGGNNLKRKLFGDWQGQKILFVAFQSPSDTTTNYFCSQVRTYSNFVHQINMLPILLEETEWKVIYKNHPLSIEKANIPGAICVDSYHIGDILEACDAVALINSGVGVLAAAYQKPVYNFGQAFYQCKGLNQAVSSAEELVDYLENKPVRFDIEKSIRFISYLINQFYSFATWERKERKHTDKANLSISLNIEYNTVRICHNGKMINVPFGNNKTLNLRDSFLFDRYRLDDYIFKTENEKKLSPLKNKPVENKPKTVEKPKPVETTVSTTTQAKIDKAVLADSVARRIAPANDLPAPVRKLRKMMKNPKLFVKDFLLKRFDV